MTFVHTVATKLPTYRYTTSEIVKAASGWLKSTPEEQALFERLSSATLIENRAFAIPLEEILSLNGTATRASIFQEVGPTLLHDVMAQALEDTALHPSDVQGLVFTSCSVPSIPAIDVPAIHSLRLSPSILRVPIFQHGCAGGAVGLAFADRVSTPQGITLLASVELCSLVYQSKNLSGGNLVGSAIFGDGAACAVLSQTHGPLEVLGTQSYLIPNSYNLMGYDILDDGTHLRLDREVPQCLATTAPDTIHSFLARHSLTAKEIAWWIFHPGGAKILSTLENSLRLSRAQTRWGWETLRDNGNMSSASVLFALSAFLRDKPYKTGDKLLMLGVGPGLTLQLNLFECHA